MAPTARVSLLIQVKEDQRGAAARAAPHGGRQPPTRSTSRHSGTATHTRPTFVFSASAMLRRPAEQNGGASCGLQ